MRAVEIAYRHSVRGNMPETVTGKPRVQVEGWRLDFERRFAEFTQIEINCMVRRGTNRGGNTGKHRQCRTMNMSGGDKLHPRMPLDDRCQFSGIEKILPIHVPDAGHEWRMVQEQ